REDVPARALGEHRSEEAVLLDALADALDVSPVRVLRVGGELIDRRQLVLLRGECRLGWGHVAPHGTQNPKLVRATARLARGTATSSVTAGTPPRRTVG